jgi:hypothetical protein
VSKTTKKPVTPTPTPTPEQLVERARQQARLDEMCAAVETLLARAKRTAGLMGVQVITSSGDLLLGFGVDLSRTSYTPLVELRVRCAELTGAQLRAAMEPGAPEYRPTLTCKPSAYSLGSDATLDSAEAQGRALLEAAQFGRTLLALLNATE